MQKIGGLRELKQTRVRQAIFDAAMALAQEKGFDATTVDEIAARAFVSRATFFNHFQTKDGVLRYFGERLTERSVELLAGDGRDESPLQRIHAFLNGWAQLIESDLPQARLILEYSVRNLDYLANPSPARQRIWDLFTELVEEGQRRNQIRGDLPPRHIALHILSIYQGALLGRVLGSKYVSELMDSAWDFVLGGMKGADSMAE